MQDLTGYHKGMVLDTNVPIHDPDVIEHLLDNVIIIPINLIEEIDRNKKGNTSKAYAARAFSRNLDRYRERGSLRDGVKTDSGGLLLVDFADDNWEDLPPGLDRSNDNRIILIARKWMSRGDLQVIILSKDINLRVKANFLRLEAEDYEFDKSLAQLDDLYTGRTVIELTSQEASVITELHRSGSIPRDKIRREVIDALLPNQCCTLDYNGKTALAVYKPEGKFIQVVKPRPRAAIEEGRVVPRNDEQAFMLSLLLDDDIRVLTLAGKTGAGKTLFALLAGMMKLAEGRYKRIKIFRDTTDIGRPIGFLPGTIEEKFGPFTDPIIDNIDMILEAGRRFKLFNGSNVFDGVFSMKNMTEKGLLVISPINYLRGVTFRDSFVILEEPQNNTPHEVTTYVTRIGFGSKVVLTGDLKQIDNITLDGTTSGFTRIIEKVKGQPFFGHILLTKAERDPVCDILADLLLSD